MKERMPIEGEILIADPFMRDINFLRSVVYLCQVDQSGALGFILNKRLGQRLGDLFSEVKGVDFPVFFGGPVHTDTIHFFHIRPDLVPGGQKLSDTLFWGGDFDIALELVKAGQITMEEIKFFLGQSGWGNQQLRQELLDKSWLIGAPKIPLVFQIEESSIWQASVKSLGKKYEPVIHYPIDPQLN